MENQRNLVQVDLPFSFREEHRRATLKYLAERRGMSRSDWSTASKVALEGLIVTALLPGNRTMI